MPTLSNSKIVPCIWFDDQAQEAATFYARTLPGGRTNAASHYPETAENPSGKPRGSLLTAEFEVAGQRFTALNGGPMFVLNPSISFFIQVGTTEEVDHLFAALAEGGEALIPIDSYPWSERYAWVKDRFGVSWQPIKTNGAQGAPGGGAATIAPCLMFAGKQHGRAEEAMRFYAGVFPDGRIETVERYSGDEGPPGTVKHGRFRLAGQEMVAMDSHVAHDTTFNEALSLMVMCKDQDEVDRYRDALGEGGEHGPCGWLKDRFGLSWQVVPSMIGQWLTSKDSAARDRAFGAVMQMSKLDIAAIQRAFAGR